MRHLSTASRPVLVPTQPPVQKNPELFGGRDRLALKLTTHQGRIYSETDEDKLQGPFQGFWGVSK
jgi:hypothetical protein